MDLYIRLHYEPLVEDYDEARYFTRDFDKKLVKVLRAQGVEKDGNKVSSISLKGE